MIANLTRSVPLLLDAEQRISRSSASFTSSRSFTRDAPQQISAMSPTAILKITRDLCLFVLDDWLDVTEKQCVALPNQLRFKPRMLPAELRFLPHDSETSRARSHWEASHGTQMEHRRKKSS